ncbi:hypothetical protein C6H69_14705 [Photorhabdus luminescens]|nr:hypothetical protein C6H69_14705 [Photorhabdus luminescens]
MQKYNYLCPANDKLRLVSTVKPSEKSRGHRVYTGANCANCLKKEKCTQAKKGRKIKRYPEDEARDKLRSRMTQPDIESTKGHGRTGIFCLTRYPGVGAFSAQRFIGSQSGIYLARHSI